MSIKEEFVIIKTRATTPRAAAIAGILFSVILLICLALIWISIPATPLESGDWLYINSRNVDLALNLLPFAGIAFLWFIGVVRDRLDQHEDRLFATVFLGSGLLFLGMLFVSAAVAGGTISLFYTMPDFLIQSGIYTFGRMVTYEIMNVYTMRMAGVFMISTCTLSLRTGIIPRWMAILGLLLATFLLLSTGFFFWSPVVFPLWVLLISVYILVANLRKRGDKPAATVME